MKDAKKKKKILSSSCALIEKKRKNSHHSGGRRRFFFFFPRLPSTTVSKTCLSTHGFRLLSLYFLCCSLASSPCLSFFLLLFGSLHPPTPPSPASLTAAGLESFTFSLPRGLPPAVVSALSLSSSVSSRASSFPPLQSSLSSPPRRTSLYSSRCIYGHPRPHRFGHVPKPPSSSSASSPDHTRPHLLLSLRADKQLPFTSVRQFSSSRLLLSLATVAPFRTGNRKKLRRLSSSASLSFPRGQSSSFPKVDSGEEEEKKKKKKEGHEEERAEHNGRTVGPRLLRLGCFPCGGGDGSQWASFFPFQRAAAKQESFFCQRKPRENGDGRDVAGLLGSLRTDRWRGGRGGRPVETQRRKEEEEEGGSGRVEEEEGSDDENGAKERSSFRRNRARDTCRERKRASSPSVLSALKTILLRSQIEQRVEDLNILLREQGSTDRLYLVLPLTFHLNPSAEHFSHDHIMEGDKASFPKEVLHLLLERRWEAPWQFLIERVHSPLDGALEDFFSQAEEGEDEARAPSLETTEEGDEDERSKRDVCGSGLHGVLGSAEIDRHVEDASSLAGLDEQKKKKKGRREIEEKEEEEFEGSSLSRERAAEQHAVKEERKIRETPSPRRISLSVLDFSAPRNFLFLPPWVMRNLKLKPLSVVACKWVRLPLAAHVSLQPLSKNFRRYLEQTKQNVQKVLEDELRHYSSLSRGTEIPIKMDTNIFHLRVVDVSAEENEASKDSAQETAHVSVQDSDVATSLVPAEGEEDFKGEPSSTEEKEGLKGDM